MTRVSLSLCPNLKRGHFHYEFENLAFSRIPESSDFSEVACFREQGAMVPTLTRRGIPPEPQSNLRWGSATQLLTAKYVAYLSFRGKFQGN